ncbi:MAG TPA: hypothetical protein DEP05_01225 [Betaproteobacteria bacterium]|nr:hypothetical protein [Betaproteobacteria bacterium]
MTISKWAVVAAIPLMLLGGCATNLSGEAYSRDQVRQVQTVQLGVVQAVRQVQIEGTKSGVGAASGAVVGGIAGSNIGEGKGSAVGAVIGAVAGGLAGAAAENAVTRKPGVEITVKLDNGQIIAVTQQSNGAAHFAPGDRVRVLTGAGATRVERD